MATCHCTPDAYATSPSATGSHTCSSRTQRNKQYFIRSSGKKSTISCAGFTSNGTAAYLRSYISGSCRSRSSRAQYPNHCAYSCGASSRQGKRSTRKKRKVRNNYHYSCSYYRCYYGQPIGSLIGCRPRLLGQTRTRSLSLPQLQFLGRFRGCDLSAESGSS